jgi:hypothetical protein
MPHLLNVSSVCYHTHKHMCKGLKFRNLAHTCIPGYQVMTLVHLLYIYCAGYQLSYADANFRASVLTLYSGIYYGEKPASFYQRCSVVLC